MRSIGQDAKLRRIRKSGALVDLRDLHRRSVQYLRRVGKQVEICGRKVAQDLQSLVIRGAAATTGYTIGLLAAQALGYGLRISCATPLLSSCLGGIGVASASVLAGQFAKCANLMERQGLKAISTPEFRQIQARDVVTDILIGVFFYKCLGGRFRNLMPSDLRFVGGNAVDSIPARSSSYATEQEKEILKTFFERSGCHSCGTRSGKFVCDHMPPNKFAQLADPRAVADRLGFGKQTRAVLDFLEIENTSIPQRFYPQCSHCSIKQAHAVRMNKQVLVLHFGGPKAHHTSGLMVGIIEHE